MRCMPRRLPMRRREVLANHGVNLTQNSSVGTGPLGLHLEDRGSGLLILNSLISQI